MQKGNQQYELTFILDEKADETAATAKVKELTDFVEKQGGKVTKEEPWGRRELAYEIKRNRSGFYVTLWIDYPSTGLKALDQQLRFDEAIIRSLVTKAYTSAQPGSLYPVVEEEKKPERTGRSTEPKATAEEMLRRSAGTSTRSTKKEDGQGEEALPEEERLKKLDDTLEELLKD